jgi:hypothetical protein
MTSLGADSNNAAPFGWWLQDTQGVAVNAISTDQAPVFYLGSLKLAVGGNAANDKAGVEGSFGQSVPQNLNIFSDSVTPPNGIPILLGTLGDLIAPDAKITVDYYAVGPLTTTSYPALRLFLALPGTPGVTPTQWVALVWENSYQSGTNRQSAVNQWITVDMTTALFWQRKYNAPRASYQNQADAHLLAQWASGVTAGPAGTSQTPVLSPSTGVYYMQVSLGTGISTPTTAYVDNPTLVFASARYSANFEPAP